jgi:hypothetical protein
MQGAHRRFPAVKSVLVAQRRGSLQVEVPVLAYQIVAKRSVVFFSHQNKTSGLVNASSGYQNIIGP